MLERLAIAFLLIGCVVGECPAGTYGEGCKKDCEAGTYGKDCKEICGYCETDKVTIGNKCNITTGECEKLASGHRRCIKGWQGDQCNQAICEPGCNNGGICIAPDTCFCGADINIVGPTCDDIRVRGVVGSIAAFATVTASIALCGLGSKLYKRRKEGASL